MLAETTHTASLLLAILVPAILLVAFEVYVLTDLYRAQEVAHLPKWAWLLIILCSIPLGAILYLLIGRKHS